jgi:hypothetical protein
MGGGSSFARTDASSGTSRGGPVVCQSINHSAALKDVTDKLRTLIDSLRGEVDLRFATETHTDWQLEGRSGTLRVIEAGASKAAASKKGRAGTIARLHLTELAFWEFAGETLNALLECVPAGSDSEIQIESTANGAGPSVTATDRDVKRAAGSATFHWRYQDAREGKSEYRAHFFEWWQTEEYSSALDAGETIEPRPGDTAEHRLAQVGVTAGQLKWRRAKVVDKGADTFDQEYPGDDVTCFLLSGRTFFDKGTLKALWAHVAPPIETILVGPPESRGMLKIWHHADRSSAYVISGDPSSGTGGDPSAAIVRERGTGRHMATLSGQMKPWDFAAELAALGIGRYGTRREPAIIAVERNNHGGTCLRALSTTHRYPRIFFDRDKYSGWWTSRPSRTAALETLEKAMRDAHWQSHDADVLGEMWTFAVVQHGQDERAEAAGGAHDDLVMAEAICWDVLCRPVQSMVLDELPYA